MIINGDYEGDVDCGGRFEIGSTGRVKGKVKAQVLVVKEGAHFEGGVIMTPEGRASSNAPAPARIRARQGRFRRDARSRRPRRRPARAASSTSRSRGRSRPSARPGRLRHRQQLLTR